MVGKTRLAGAKAPMRLRSFNTRLTLIVVAPIFVAYLALLLILGQQNRLEEEQDIGRRGPAIAAFVAESAQYPIVSANTAVLRHGLETLVSGDQTIGAIAVCNPNGTVLASAGTGLANCTGAPFVAPVRRIVAGVDTLAGLAAPSGNSGNAPDGNGQQTPQVARDLGTVAVLMRPASANAFTHASAVFVFGTFGLIAFAAMLLGLALLEPMRRAMSDILDCLGRISIGDYHMPSIGSAAAPDELLRDAQNAVREAALTLHARDLALREQIRALQSANMADAAKRQHIGRLNQILEEDRRRLSADLHDQLGANFAGAAMLAHHLETMGRQAQLDPSTLDLPNLIETSHQIASAVEQSYGATRSIVKALRPETLELVGLSGALSQLVESYDQKHSSCTFELRCPDSLPEVDREASIIVYRVVQEALTNVVKHSFASHVVVTVTITPGQDQLFFKIEDDGKGFETKGVCNGQTYGLMGMRERVAAGGGQLHIASSPQGTTVTVSLPTHSPPQPTPDDAGPITLSPPEQPTLF